MNKFLFLLFLSTISLSQNTQRKFINATNNGDNINVEVTDGVYTFVFLTDKITQTTFIPKGETFNPLSHAVILQEKVKNLTFLTNENTLFIFPNFGKLKIVIQKTPFKISYENKNKEIISEKNGYTKVNDSLETINFNITSNEVLYGGGARAIGMNRRGNRLQLYNRASYGYQTHADLMNFCIPLVLSSNLYAIHFDNAAIGWLDLDSKKNNTLVYETISGRKTYQVIIGDSWENLVSNYTDLTGKQPLPPLWAFGNFSSRFGYHSQEEVENTIKKFEEDKIPVDAIILDLYWFGKTVKGTMGNLDWDKDNFPNPEKMISDLNSKGVKTVLISEPFVLTTSSKWKEAVDKKVLATDKNGNPFSYDFYFGNTGIIDIFKPEGKKWFWNVYKRLINQGIAGLWGDLGEPEVFPSLARTTGGKADEVHNIYGHNWAKLIADGYNSDFPKQRPFILMRAGYSGSQRFGMIPWSGDVSRSWGGLQSQMEIALQMGMQGMGYMHSDLGGFAGDYFDNELYLRWLQYGVFNPIFRPHAQEEVASEVARKDVLTKAKAKICVELRYQLLPYNYTLAYQNSTTGIPLMRPLFFYEPENENLKSISNEYLWGNDFLIKPITKAGITSTTVYFPKNNNWYDFYTDKKYSAGSNATIKVMEQSIPTFVRSGSFIPMIKSIQNTTKYSLNSFDLHFYYDPQNTKSTSKLYNDDGQTPNAFENGAYEIIQFQSNVTAKDINIKINTQTGKSYQSNAKNINLIVHNCHLQPKKVILNGKQLAFKTSNKQLKILIIPNNTATNEIKIQF